MANEFAVQVHIGLHARARMTLLDGGADLYARNNAGETPLQLAEGHVDTERIMQDYLARDSN